MVGKKKKSVQILVFIVLIIGAIWAGFPVLWMFSETHLREAEIFTWPPTWISKNFSLSAYGKILTNPEQLRFFLNSYVIAALVVIVTLIIGIMASYAFSRFNFPGKKLINTVIVAIQAVPPITLLIPYLSLIVTLKLYNTYWALVLTYMYLHFRIVF